MSTAEVESALILHKGVAETAVVGSHDDITGQAVYAFVTMKPEFDLASTKEADLSKELAIQVRKVIGPFAAPKKIFLVNDLPKTRSGKIVSLCPTSRAALTTRCAVSCERLLLARVTNWETCHRLPTRASWTRVSLPCLGGWLSG